MPDKMELDGQESKIDVKSLTLEELKEELEKNGEKPFRAVQLYQWMHQKLAKKL